MIGNEEFSSLLRKCALAVIVAGATFSAAARAACTEQVDSLFAPWDREDSPGAVVGVFEKGRILHARGYGIANLDYGIPLSPQTVLRTGSISKQFVAMGVALLAEQGKLSIGDDVRKFLPEFPDYGTPITIDHLVHHTSGIREYLTLVSLIGKPEGSGYVYTPEDVLSLLSRQKALEFEPGDIFSYSNSGYFLLAQIISRVSGTSASSFLEKHIFEPLGMESTRLHDDPNAIIRNRGIGYSPTRDGGYRMNILRLKVVGDLGVITSIEDFFKWDQNFYDNQLGNASRELMDTIMAPGTLNNGEKLSYGHGLFIDRYRGLETIGHDGSAVGYVGDYLRFPEQQFSILVLSNLSSFSPEVMTRKIADLCLADRFTEAQASPPAERAARQSKPTRALSTSEVATYLGDYYSEELDTVYRLRRVDGSLDLTINALSGIVRAYADDHLWWSPGEAEFLFTREPGGEIEGFYLRSGSVQGLLFVKLSQ